MNWEWLPLVAPLTDIEEVHLSLEAAMLGRSLRQPTPHFHLDPDSNIATMFARTEDESVMQKLGSIYTDLTTNTLRVMSPELKALLREWLENMKKRGVTVKTYIKTSKYADHRYCSLEEAWDAEPHWEFWERSGVVNEVRKWVLLAKATGRDNMNRTVTGDGSECQWFGDAQ
jgi:hypothetical protein